jgi:gamma-glutamyl:cysteine ligase YbdK (ATP-grasp superfamily)
MGRDIPAIAVSPQQRRAYEQKARRCLDVLGRMLRESAFAAEPPRLGLEIELNLVDAAGLPSMKNTEVLTALADPAWASELGQFNLEINVPPRQLRGGALSLVERDVLASLEHAGSRAAQAGSRLVMIGILPTLSQADVGPQAMSSSPRFRLLNEQMFAARGEDMRISIEGCERLDTHADTITPEAACTSAQLHLQVSPEAFGSYWNAAQAVAGVQVALAANSPYLFGRELWAETRLILFEQATDARPAGRPDSGVRPRVWFGEAWAGSVTDLFEENLRYFPALLPVSDAEDPAAVLDRGRVPRLAELTLHNGTIYRWNRPVYDVSGGEPHLRVENRVLPAGPTVADVLANAAFYYGVVRALADAEQPVRDRLPFAAAAQNLERAARHGIEARLEWPGLGRLPVTELVLDWLLPMAADGLRAWGVDDADAGRFLGVIEQRCLARRTGATWQVEAVRALEARGLAPRSEALRLMTQGYIERMRSNEPVHDWPPI